MKSFLLSCLLLGSIGLNIYLLNTEVVVENNLDENTFQVNDEIKIAQSAIKKAELSNKKHKRNNRKIRKSFLPEDTSSPSVEHTQEKTENAVYEVQYQESLTKWDEKLNQHLELDLNLTPDEIQQFNSILKKRMTAINSYMEPILREQDPEVGYMNTVEDNIEISKINITYSEYLKGFLGPVAYEAYANFRKNHNANEFQNGTSHVYVEF